MRRTFPALVLLVALLVAPASAYLKLGTRVDTRTVTLRWEEFPVRYFVTNAAGGGVTAEECFDGELLALDGDAAWGVVVLLVAVGGGGQRRHRGRTCACLCHGGPPRWAVVQRDLSVTSRRRAEGPPRW